MNDGLDRRDFLSGASAAFLCTLAGQKVLTDRPADVEALAADVPVPPRVDAAQRDGAAEGDAVLASQSASAAISGVRREYWIRAEEVRWNIVPTGRDEMMAERVKGRTTFRAYAYRRYTPGFAKPMGPATIPGPRIVANTGDQIVVHFQNKLRAPVTMHPHGVFYGPEMDGAYKGRFTDPGGFVQRNRTFTYVWEAREGTEGAWLYHDHGPMDPLPLFKGLFGTMIIRKAGDPVPDVEQSLAFHSFAPLATGLGRPFSCVNGRSFAGNTPTVRTRLGQNVALHVFGIDDEFHTFHVHGHRWTDADGGRVIDNKTFGPGDAFTVALTEDNPGRWFYHCHVFSHLHMGMNGWYIAGQ